MSPVTAAQVRRDAVARLAEIAGYDDRLNVDLTLARPDAFAMLGRQALHAAMGDDLLLEEVRMLFPVGRGQAAALFDATTVHGLPSTTPELGGPVEDSATEDLATVLQEALT